MKRKCNLAKVINSRCHNTHQGKVSIKRSTTQVKNKPKRDAKQAFMIGEDKWYTTSGEDYKPSGQKVEYGSQYYIDIINELKQQLNDREEVSY